MPVAGCLDEKVQVIVCYTKILGNHIEIITVILVFCVNANVCHVLHTLKSLRIYCKCARRLHIHRISMIIYRHFLNYLRDSVDRSVQDILSLPVCFLCVYASACVRVYV